MQEVVIAPFSRKASLDISSFGRNRCRRVNGRDGNSRGLTDSFSSDGCSHQQSKGSSESWGCRSVKFSARNFVSQSCGDLDAHYDTHELLGEGGFGAVYACTHIESGAERAVKVIEKDPYDEEENEKVIAEFNTLKDLDHPNILKMYELFEDDANFYIITDIYRGGELYDELERWGTLREEDTAVLMNNVLSCVNYCHKRNLVHRDLKPENILLEENMDFNDLKIIDFGLAMDDDTELTEFVGSSYYISPQVVEGKYDRKTDIWSCGVIAFVCLSGYAPFDGDTNKEILASVLGGDFNLNSPEWSHVSDQAKDFVKMLLTYEDDQRPTAEVALEHPWLREMRKVSLEDNSKNHDSARASLAELKNFSTAGSKLKQAVCAIISSQLMGKHEKEEIDTLFRSLDVDCDGKISMDDMKASYHALGVELDEEELYALFDEVNFSNTGCIEYSEFAIATMLEKDMIDDAKLRTVFRRFDHEGKGFISHENLKHVLGLEDSLDSYITKIIKQVDSDGDGMIDFEEFKNMMFNTLKDPQHLPVRRSSLICTSLEYQQHVPTRRSSLIFNTLEDPQHVPTRRSSLMFNTLEDPQHVPTRRSSLISCGSHTSTVSGTSRRPSLSRCSVRRSSILGTSRPSQLYSTAGHRPSITSSVVSHLAATTHDLEDDEEEAKEVTQRK